MALLGTHAAYCQDDGWDDFFIESFTVTEPGETGAAIVPGVDDYDIDLRLSSGLALRRSFSRSEIDVRSLAFGTGISEEAYSEAVLTLGDRTAMSFSVDESTVSDVLLDLVKRDTITTMQLSQGFGGGSSSGLFTLARSLHTEETPDAGELRTLTQRMGLQTGLGDGAHLTAGFMQRHSEEDADRLQETGYSAELTMALSGGEGLAHYDYLHRLVEGRSSEERKLDLVAPFAVPGGTLLAAHHLHERLSDTRQQIDRETKLIVPLGILHDGAQASFIQMTKIRNDNKDEKSEFAFVTPLQFFGYDTTFEHIATETIKNEHVEDERVYRLSADVSGSPALIERIDTIKPEGDDHAHHRRLRIQSPELGISDQMSLSASQVRQERDGEETSRVSRVALTFQPFDPLEVAAYHTTHQRPGESATRDHDIRTRLRLTDNARLSGLLTEKERREGAPEIVRHLELQRARSNDRDVDVRVGYTSFGVQEEELETGMLAQISVGDQSNLGLSATYAEYHDKKLEPLKEPTTSLEVRAGDPSQLGLRAAYSDQAGRPEPERTIGVATSLFGGALKLDYMRNTLDPLGKEVMLSDVYELGFRRSVFGGVAMDLGYRYFVPRADSPYDTDHFFKLQLDGGKARDGGKISLSYLSGHFVPYPRRGDPPASLLDLTYEKRWLDDGRLTVSLSREEPPVLSVNEEENIEAQIKLETVF